MDAPATARGSAIATAAPYTATRICSLSRSAATSEDSGPGV
ncbi:hypothetical protein [Streptomyces sp. SS1-1]|nr:hypothetical protein [Streptomyces sp. SS1-1]